MNQFLLHEVKFCPTTCEASISRLAAASCLCCPCLTTATGVVWVMTARSPWITWTSVASSTTAATTPWWPAGSARWSRRVITICIIVSQGTYSRCRTRCCPPTPGHGTVRTPWCATTAQSEWHLILLPFTFWQTESDILKTTLLFRSSLNTGDQYGYNPAQTDDSGAGAGSTQCSCQTCLCDVSLAQCLQRTGQCPPPVFGLLGEIGRKIRG